MQSLTYWFYHFQQPLWVACASELCKTESKDPTMLFGQFPPVNIEKIFGRERSLENIQWTLGNFEFGKFICEGSFGEVYLARERSSLYIVALKVISKTIREGESMVGILAEITNQARLQHPNVLSVFSYFYDEENIFLILKYIPGGDLREHCSTGVTEETAAGYMADLVEALEYYHSQNIIHTDLKPENLLLGSGGNIIIADFGSSVNCSMVGTCMKTSTCNGYNEYWAPEMYTSCFGKEVDAWALGVLLYEFLVGKPPYQTKEETLNDSIPYPTEKNISGDAKDLISQLLENDPKKCKALNTILQHPFMLNNERS